MNNPIDIPQAEFLTHYLFHRINVGRPDYRDWHTLASAAPPPGTTTFEDLADYALAFNGYEYAKEVLKTDAFEGFEKHCRHIDRAAATIEDPYG